MTVTMTTTTGDLNYINPVAAPSNPQEPLKIALGSGSNSSNEILVPKQKTIRNGRLSRFHLGRDGFELLQGISRPSHEVLQDPRDRFFSMRELVEPMAMRLAEERLGLKTCYYTFSTIPFVRRASSGVATRDHHSSSTPHAMVHSDFGFDTANYFTLQNGSGDFNIRNPQKEEEVESAFQKAGRMVVLQFWFNAQAEGSVIEQDTLALCHPRSIQASDLVTRPLKEYHGFPTSLSILQSKDSPAHEWFYWPSLATDECLVWIGYDSAWGVKMTPCFHSSFHDNTVPNSAQPRESIECRVYLLLDEKPPPVIATLNYIKPEAAPASPKEILQVKKGQPIQSFLAGKKKLIRNARGIQFDLKKDGFELLTGVSRPQYSCFQHYRRCYEACNQTFLPLAVQIARRKFGMEPYHVHLAPPYVRKTPSSKSITALDQREHRSGWAPHAVVHNDYGYDSYQRMVDGHYFNYKNSKRARDAREAFRRAGRVVVLQFWMSAQPEGTVIENDALTLCHPRSVEISDLVSRKVVGYDRIPVAFSTLHSKDSPKHEWFYWPSMTTEECLVWVGYDSSWGDKLTPCFHTSFHDDSPDKSLARPRESIECRVHLLLDEQVRSRL